MRIAMFLLPLVLAGCASTPEKPAQLTEKQALDLEKELAGKVAGEKTTCISRYNQTSMRAISNEVLLYRVSRNLVYKNELIGRCSGLTRGNTLIVESFGSQYCRGDIARVADLTVGMLTGSCALGDFIPYRTPRR